MLERVREQLQGLVHQGRSSLLFTMNDAGEVGTKGPAPALGPIERLKLRLSHYQCFENKDWAARIRQRAAEVRELSANPADVRLLHATIREAKGKEILDEAIANTPLSQRHVTVQGTPRVDAASALALVDRADRAEQRVFTGNRHQAMQLAEQGEIRRGLREGRQAPCTGRDKFAATLLMRLVEEHPDARKRPLSEIEMRVLCARVAHQLDGVLDRMDQLEAGEAGAGPDAGPDAAPGAGPDALPGPAREAAAAETRRLFDAACSDSRAEQRSQSLMNEITALVLERECMAMLSDDPHRESPLWQAVAEQMSKDPHVPEGTATTRLVSVLSKGLKADIMHRVRSLVEEHMREPAAPGGADALRAHCRDRFVACVQRAVSEHFEALVKIEADDRLNPAQRRLLIAKARKERIDPVMVEAVIQAGRKTGEAIAALRQRAGAGDADGLAQTLQDLRELLASTQREIIQHAEDMWMGKAVDGAEPRANLEKLCVSMGLAGMSLSADDAGQLVEDLVGRDGTRAREAVRTFMQASDQSPSIAFCDLSTQYLTLVTTVDGCAHPAPAPRDDEFLDAPSRRETMEEAQAREDAAAAHMENFHERLLGEPMPPADWPQALLKRSMLDPNPDHLAQLDESGAVGTAAHHDWVDPAFRADACFATFSPRLALVDPMNEKFGGFEHVTLRLENAELQDEKDNPKLRQIYIRLREIHAPQQAREILVQIAARLNGRVLDQWNDHLQQAAFRGAAVVRPDGHAPHDEFDVDILDDGTCELVAYRSFVPVLAQREQGNELLSGEGVLMTEIRWRIDSPSFAPAGSEPVSPDLSRRSSLILSPDSDSASPRDGGASQAPGASSSSSSSERFVPPGGFEHLPEKPRRATAFEIPGELAADMTASELHEMQRALDRPARRAPLVAHPHSARVIFNF